MINSYKDKEDKRGINLRQNAELSEISEKIANLWSSGDDTEYNESDLNDEDWAEISRNKDFTKQYNRYRNVSEISKNTSEGLKILPRMNIYTTESKRTFNSETTDVLNKYMSRLNLENYIPINEKLINKGFIYKINGCVSTGKEANVYHAITEKGEQRAIKVPYPRLKDVIISKSKYTDLYLQLLYYVRIIYQVCHLVHADLSEYNILYHSKTLYIIDVSQSVEHNHPRSLEFLRMDISNVNDFFRKNGVVCLNERAIFDFVISDSGGITKEEIQKTLFQMQNSIEYQEPENFKEDIVFKYSYIPQTLGQVRNIEEDLELINKAEGSSLAYKRLINIPSESKTDTNTDSEYSDTIYSLSDDKFNNDKPESNFSRLKKFEDKNVKKERKTQIKELNKKRREYKIRKAEKKRQIKASKKGKNK
ncbi:hypothetical protein PMAC_000208 [Pneumocystis sp. 'macacae']|nr:hypothetical protein PMAC_000208 [Pneumocystis sp. 'macacae']